MACRTFEPCFRRLTRGSSQVYVAHNRGLPIHVWAAYTQLGGSEVAERQTHCGTEHEICTRRLRNERHVLLFLLSNYEVTSFRMTLVSEENPQ